jgi:hypothetical protein
LSGLPKFSRAAFRRCAGTMPRFERFCGDSESILGRRAARETRTNRQEAAVEQIFGVVGSGSLFLSYCAYCEARDALQTASFRVSPGRAKLAGLAAAFATLATGCLICLLLARAGALYDAGAL